MADRQASPPRHQARHSRLPSRAPARRPAPSATASFAAVFAARTGEARAVLVREHLDQRAAQLIIGIASTTADQLACERHHSSHTGNAIVERFRVPLHMPQRLALPHENLVGPREDALGVTIDVLRRCRALPSAS